MFKVQPAKSFAGHLLALLVLGPVAAIAQTADPHAQGHSNAHAQSSQMEAMPGMDMSSMAGMNHGTISTGFPAGGAKSTAPMAGKAPGATRQMVMSDGSMMAMTPMPKGIERRISGPAEAALQAFTDALEVGNRDLAVARLAPDLKVVENGVEQGFAAYVGGHLAEDIDFGKTVKRVLLDRHVTHESSGVATIVSTTRMIGNRSDKPMDVTVAEQVTVAKSVFGWQLQRIEWNSSPTIVR